MDRLTEPASLGFRDVDAPSLRIYYPAPSPGGRNAPVLPLDNPLRPYPLVLFIHGQRGAQSSNLCPPDISRDHMRWDTLLPLPARCGLVIVAVNVSDTISTPALAAADAVEGLLWARTSWEGRHTVFEPPIIFDPDLPPPLPTVGAIGHSWGAKAAAQLGVQRRVRCIATVSGTWDDSESRSTLANAKVPTLLIAGTGDGVPPDPIDAQPRSQPFCVLSQPRHQLTLLGIRHWDLSEIGPCDDPRPPQTGGSRVIAAEALVVFLHRYLYNANTLHPSLLAAPIGNRPPITPHVTGSGVCAVRARWQDPFTGGVLGESSLGNWSDGGEPWALCPPPPPLVFEPELVFFGQVPIGSVRVRTLTIRNPSQSTASLSFPGSSSVFLWNSFNGTLDPGQTRQVSISFRPPSTQILETALVVTSNTPGSPHRITIRGKGAGGFPVPAP